MNLYNNDTVPFSDTEGYLGMRKAATLLDRNIGSVRLLRFLRRRKYLDKRNQPYLAYIENGFFRKVIKVTYGFKGKVRHYHLVPLISKSCIAAIWDQVRKDFDVRGTDIYYPYPPIYFDDATIEFFEKLFPIKTATPSTQIKTRTPC